MRKFDLLGKTFNNLKVLSSAKSSKHGHSKWWVECNCGRREKFCVTGDNLIRSRVIQCKLCKLEKIGKSRLNAPKRIPTYESALNEMYSNYRYHAKKRNYVFELTKIDFKNIVELSCYYCGILSGRQLKTGIKKQYSWNVNGIDRLNNKIGYTISNSVACCSLCNKMKGTLTKDSFIEQAKKIYNFNKI